MSLERLSRRALAAAVISLTRSAPTSAQNLDCSPHAQGSGSAKHPRNSRNPIRDPAEGKQGSESPESGPARPSSLGSSPTVASGQRKATPDDGPQCDGRCYQFAGLLLQSTCLRPSVSPYPRIREHLALARALFGGPCDRSLRAAPISSHTASDKLPPPFDSGSMRFSGSIRVIKRDPEMVWRSHRGPLGNEHWTIHMIS